MLHGRWSNHRRGRLTARSAPLGQSITGHFSILKDARLVVSDDHDGIEATVVGELPGVWQRCVVHFERNVLSHVPASSMAGVTEVLKALFKARRQKTAWALAEEFVELYGGRFPKVRRWFGCSRRG